MSDDVDMAPFFASQTQAHGEEKGQRTLSLWVAQDGGTRLNAKTISKIVECARSAVAKFGGSISAEEGLGEVARIVGLLEAAWEEDRRSGKQVG